MSSPLQPGGLELGRCVNVWMCVGTINTVSTIDRIQLIACVCLFLIKMTRIKTDKSEKNTSFHFPHRLWDKDSLFDEKSNSPDSSGDVSVYLFVFLALSQSPHARDKRGRKKRVPIMREKSKSNRVGHQRCRPSAVKVGAGSGPRGCERQAAVGISWSRSVIAAAGLPPPQPPLHMDHLGDLFMEPIPASGSELIRATHACFV